MNGEQMLAFIQQLTELIAERDRYREALREIVINHYFEDADLNEADRFTTDYPYEEAMEARIMFKIARNALDPQERGSDEAA